MSLAMASACSGNSSHVLFLPKPECEGSAVVPYAGANPQVINTLAIGTEADGFDLDGKVKPENKLGAVSSLAASSINNALANYSVVIPMEFFFVALCL